MASSKNPDVLTLSSSKKSHPTSGQSKSSRSRTRRTKRRSREFPSRCCLASALPSTWSHRMRRRVRPEKFVLGPVSRVKLSSKYGRSALSMDIISLSTPSAPTAAHRLISILSGTRSLTRTEQLQILANLLREPGCASGLIAGDFNAPSALTCSPRQEWTGGCVGRIALRGRA